MKKYKSLVTGSLVALMIVSTPLVIFAEKNNDNGKNEDNGNTIRVEQTSRIKNKNGFLNFGFKGNSEFSNAIFHRFQDWFTNKNKNAGEEDNKTTSSTSTTTNENLAPSILGITAPTVLNVNEVGTWEVKASDPQNGSLSYAIDWGDTNLVSRALSLLSPQVFVQTGTFTHSFALKGTYRIRFTVSNEAGLKTVSTVTVHIVDASVDTTTPVIKNVIGPNTVQVGKTEIVAIRAYDPNNKTLSYSADWGDGLIISNNALAVPTTLKVFVQTATLSHVYNTVGTYTATFTVENSDGSKTSASKTIVVTQSPVIDTSAPIITSFTTPTTSGTLAVKISAFTATDNVGVTGYKLTETATTPLVSDAGWTATAPTTYTFSSDGTKTLYAWAKDGSGNISLPLSSNTTITLTDTTSPVISNIGVNISSSSATMSWKTNEPSTSTVFYSTTAGVDTSVNNTSVITDNSLVTSHSLNIPNLTSNTLYHFVLKSIDASNNATLSSEYALMTTN